MTGVLDELEFANVDNTAGGYGIKFDEENGCRQLTFDRRFLSKILVPSAFREWSVLLTASMNDRLFLEAVPRNCRKSVEDQVRWSH